MAKAVFRAPSLPMPQWPIACRAVDHELLRSTMHSPQVFSTAHQPYPRGTGLRVYCSDARDLFGADIGEGYSDFIHVSDDLCARVVSARIDISTGMRCPGEDWLKIEVYTSGRQSLLFENVGQIDLSTRWCHVHLHPEGVVKGDWVEPGAAASGLIVYLRPEFIRDRIPECVDRLPLALRNFARDLRGTFLFESLPVSPTMARAVAEVISTPLLGSLRRLFLESKAIEIVSSALHELVDDGNRPSRARIRLRAHDIECLHFVHALLYKSYADPPRICDLARRVGLNQQKLKCGFKALFGVTIFEFVQDRRFEVAAEMLKNRGASVTEAALATGYEYPSNFSLAFKRRYGVTPRQVHRGLRVLRQP